MGVPINHLVFVPGKLGLSHCESIPIYGGFLRWLFRKPLYFEVNYYFDLFSDSDEV